MKEIIIFLLKKTICFKSIFKKQCDKFKSINFIKNIIDKNKI